MKRRKVGIRSGMPTRLHGIACNNDRTRPRKLERNSEKEKDLLQRSPRRRSNPLILTQLPAIRPYDESEMSGKIAREKGVKV